MFLLAIQLPDLYHKTKEYSNQGCPLKKTTVTFDRKKVKLKCLIKEKEARIALNKGPTISLRTIPRVPRSKSQESCSFLSKESLSKEDTDMNELYCWICNLNIYSFTVWYILHF